jgi:molybdopterin molybdotransferase
LAATGIQHVKVWKGPVVGVVETGDELVVDAAGGGVFPANGIALGSALELLGCEVHRFHASDTRQALDEVLGKALATCDVVVSTGGVSVGDYDLVRAAYLDLGVEERFWRVAIRPGKPLFFGRKPDGPWVFGLPGNPASALVTFLLFVKPMLMKAFGLSFRFVRMRLGQDVEPAATVDTFMRVTVAENLAIPVEKQGSNMISSVAKADALMQIPMGNSPVLKDTEVNVIPISWSLFR